MAFGFSQRNKFKVARVIFQFFLESVSLISGWFHSTRAVYVARLQPFLLSGDSSIQSMQQCKFYEFFCFVAEAE